MKKKYLVDYAYLTDTGSVRIVNEDQTQIIKNNSGDILMIVADGMGGCNRGDYASKVTVDFITNEFKKQKRFIFKFMIKFWLGNLINKINKIIFNDNKNSKIYSNTGTTVIIAVIHKNSLIVANVGDSRAYLYEKNSLTYLSEDQSYINFLKKTGQIKNEEIKKYQDQNNILINALGTHPSVMFKMKSLKYTTGSILLCSDGLYNNLNEQEIIEILNNDQNAQEKVTNLIKKANLNGGSDNITATLLIRKIDEKNV